MLKVNKKLEYALMALKFMADKNSEQLTSAREICDKFKTPFDTTAKVMQTMNSHGILKSVKGIKGGYTLARELSTLSYLELAKVIEGKELGTVCQTNKGLCELHGDCNIVNPMITLGEKLNYFLSTLSIQELLFSNEFCKDKGPCPIESVTKTLQINGLKL
ncbi:Rrf2 family transcriptional regulator [Halobacteriovorax sp. HLS]|uniref:RrF2 family transcriptional regulator n=1 Tax=Halobacteriovorax sp. HLS TaxID=2234000 RepID=UPI000FD8662C|nr:Rrf2 family transcriptional regulator [Halobacteriovorax sp. HLS]